MDAGVLCLCTCISSRASLAPSCGNAHVHTANFLEFDSLIHPDTMGTQQHAARPAPPLPVPLRTRPGTHLVAQGDFRNHSRYSQLAVLPVSSGLLVVHSPIAALPLHAHKTSRDRHQEPNRYSSRCRHRRLPSRPLHWQCSPRTARCPWPCPSCTY